MAGSRTTNQAGHTMAIALFLILVLMSFGFTMLSSVGSAKKEVSSTRERMRQLYLAEAALDAALLSLRTGGTGNVGSSAAPITFGGGAYWTEATDNGDGTWTVLAVGSYGRRVRVVQGRIRASTQAFHHAVFAGNSSGDPNYVLEFGGQGSHGDVVNGDVFSGGDISFTEDASSTGDLRATGQIAGGTGDTGVTQPGFDFSGFDFTDPSIVNVATQFATHGSSGSMSGGGTADEVPENNAAHIFRRNPDDRTDETSGTPKDDYFLEDPHESGGGGGGDDDDDDDDDGGGGSAPSMVSIDDGSGTTRRVFYIDGNLWVHNKSALTFSMASATGTGVQVTFLVRGNIMFSDNFELQDGALDGVAFVALVDPDEPASGNIYLGDPIYGTIERLDGYLYAERDFIDVNLDETGSLAVTINGAMTAGNHVAIQRTYGPDPDDHSKLTVNWDPRYANGTLDLPLLSSELPPRTYHLEAWAEAAPGAR